MKVFRRAVALCAALLAGCPQSPDFSSDLLAISISPGTTQTVAIGDTLQFSAAGAFSTQPGSASDTTTELISPNWSVADESVATINADGLLTAIDQGSTTVTASQDGISSSVQVVVPAPDLTRLSVTPASASITIGGNIRFTATGTYEGSDEEVAVPVVWDSSDDTVATITDGGVATGLAVGTATISASSGDRTATATLVVTDVPDLIAIEVTPATATAAVGQSVSFLASGIYEFDDGSTIEDAVEVSWSTANASIASIDDTGGVALANSVGSTEVRATNGAIVGTATITVTPPVLLEMVVTPDSASVPAGAVQTFEVRGIYSDSPAPRVISEAVSWSSSDDSIASLATTSGSDVTATGVAAGSATITASSGGLSDSATLNVTAAELVSGSLHVSPSVGRVIPGTSTEFRLMGMFTDGAEAAIDDANVSWSSSDDVLATIDGDGLATGLAEGEVTITATLVDGYEDGVSPRSATARLIIANEACAIPLLGADNATVGSDTSVGCLLCSVDGEGNVIDDDEDNFATISLPVGLLGANASLTVAADDNGSYTVPFPAGSQPGFIIGHPEGQLLTLELLSQISIETVLNSNTQETSGETTPLRLDLLGLNLIGGSDEELQLLSFETTKEYSAVRLVFRSGVATALSSLHVYSACGATALPPKVKSLVEVVRVEPDTDTVIEGASTEFTLIGRYDDGSEGPIPDSDIDWSSADMGMATIDANGVATGAGLGETMITGTLKAGVSPAVTLRSASASLEVVTLASSCTTPLLQSRGAMVDSGFEGLCILCGTVDDERIIDENDEGLADIGEDSFATMYVPVGLLNGGAYVTVSVGENNDYELPFPAAQRAGFIIAQPPGTLLSAELLSQIEVSTLRNGIVQDLTSGTTTLALDLLGFALLDDDEKVEVGLVTLEATQPFDALRFSFRSGVVTALTSVEIGAACAGAAAP